MVEGIFPGRAYVDGLSLVRSPFNPDRVVVKRVVAVEGDEVLTKQPYPFPQEIVPKGHIWVEGEHPEQRLSMDSNTYGPVHLSPLQALGPVTNV